MNTLAPFVLHRLNEQLEVIEFRPFECCTCPFAKPSCERDNCIEVPNTYDPGEGYYDCALLNKQAIWGESPQCKEEYWLGQAREVLQELSNTITN